MHSHTHTHLRTVIGNKHIIINGVNWVLLLVDRIHNRKVHSKTVEIINEKDNQTEMKRKRMQKIENLNICIFKMSLPKTLTDFDLSLKKIHVHSVSTSLMKIWPFLLIKILEIYTEKEKPNRFKQFRY